MPVSDDSRLVQQAQGGDLAAFNRLVLRHQDHVYRLCLRLLGDPDGADDAAQETFIAAYEHLGAFRGGSLRAWLLRTASRRCYDVHRRRGRRPTTSLDRPAQPGASETVVAAVPDPQAGPEASAERHELEAMLQQGLLALPEEQRTALTLCDVLGYDYQAIADIMEVELGTVKSRINRGRRRMRDHLAGHRELLPDPYRQSFGGYRGPEATDG